MNESNLIDELKKKNQEALTEVLNIYGKQIYSVAYMELKSHTLSEECLNEVLIKVWVNIDRYNYERSQFKNWILTIAKYTAIDILRKEKKHFTVKNDEAEDIEDGTGINAIEDKVLTLEEVKKVHETINSFSKIDRCIFLDRFFVGKEVKEIAKELGVTPNAVSIRINKGRKKLRELLRGENNEV